MSASFSPQAGPGAPGGRGAWCSDQARGEITKSQLSLPHPSPWPWSPAAAGVGRCFCRDGQLCAGNPSSHETVPSCAFWSGLIVNITAFTPHSTLTWVTQSLWSDGCFYVSTCLGQGRPSPDAGKRIFPVYLRGAFRRPEYLHQRLSKEVPSPAWVRITRSPDTQIEHGNEERNTLSLSCTSGSCPRASALLALGLSESH